MRIITIFFISVIFILSCTSNKPFVKNVGEYDSNGRSSITGAGYIKKLNIEGYGSLAAFSIGGAYLAGNSSMNTNLRNGKIENNEILTHGIGALIGFGIASLGNYYIFKKGNSRNISLNDELEKSKWLKDMNIEAKLLPSIGEFNIIKTNAPDYYVFKNDKDIDDFSSVFKTKNIDNVLKRSITDIPRNSILKFFDQYAVSAISNENVIALEKSYIKKSYNYNDFAESVSRFSSHKENAEKFGTSLITSFKDFKLYQSIYKNGKFRKESYINSFLTAYTRNEIKEASTLLSGKIKLPREDVLNNNEIIRKNYLFFMVMNDSPKTLSALNNSFKENEWLQIKEKAGMFLEEAWYIGKNYYKNGNTFLNQLKEVSIKGDYRHLNIDKFELESMTKLELSKIIIEDVVVKSGEVLQADEGRDFLGFTTDLSSFQYIQTATVSNNSNFDLPLLISASGFARQEARAVIFGRSMVVDSARLSYQLQLPFSIPQFKANETIQIKILFDYALPKKSGFSLGGLFDAKQIMVPQKTIFKTFLLEQSLNKETLDRQMKWMGLGKNSLSPSKIRDIFGGDPATYKVLTKDDYQKKYGQNCGCEIVSQKDDGFLIKNGHPTAIFKNGFKEDYKFEGGKWVILSILWDEKFDTYEKMISAMISSCHNRYCK